MNRIQCFMIEPGEVPTLTHDQRRTIMQSFNETRFQGGRFIGALSLNSSRVDPETGLATKIDTGGV